MSVAIIQRKKPLNSNQSAPQARFKSLQKRIDSLQRDLEKRHRDLDECLNFYIKQVDPQKKQLMDLFKTQAKLLHSFYEKKNTLSKSRRYGLKQLILNRLENLEMFGSVDKSDEELVDIYEKLYGSAYKDRETEAFESLKESIKGMFSKDGIEADFSDLKPDCSESDILKRMFETIDKRDQEKGIGDIPSFAKSPRELERETQKKEIGIIYKQLVKVMHPDLEQDLELKLEKEELMKTLTVAYKNQDLYLLLSLQEQWLAQECQQESCGDKPYEIYNLFLQKQIETLTSDIRGAISHPKYYILKGYCNSHSSDIRGVMKKELSELRKTTKANEALTQDLESGKSVQTIQRLIDCMQC